LSSQNNFIKTEIGTIPIDWSLSTFNEISSLITDGSHFSPREESKGTHLIATVKNMERNRFKFDKCKKISNDDYKSLVHNNCAPKQGDILISKDGANCLDIIFVYNQDEEIVLLSSIAIVRLKKEFNPYFYRYYLLSPNIQKLMRKGYVTGSAIPRIILKDLAKIPVVIPTRKEQDTIAKFLWSIDKKIEINNDISSILAIMTQHIFKHWFIDYEFPNEENKPYKSSGGGMVYSEELKKDIPEIWTVKSISDLCKVEIGGDWGKSEQFAKSIKVVCLRGTDLQMLKEQGLAYDAPIRWIKGDSFKKRKLTNCDILIGGSGLGPIGRTLFFSDYIQKLYPFPVVYSNFVKLIRADTPEYANYIEKFLENMYTSGKMKNSYVIGTSIPNIDLYGLMTEKIIVPKKEIVSLFSKYRNYAFQKLYNTEGRILSDIRDILLPKLMSGKIRVKALEA